MCLLHSSRTVSRRTSFDENYEPTSAFGTPKLVLSPPPSVEPKVYS